MKISVRWLEEYLDFALPDIDELVKVIGAQLGAVESVIDLGPRYKNIAVVRIVRCEDLADSDHLKVCKIDDGGKVEGIERDEHGLVQVITGAPNVHEDMFVAWLPPGSVVPTTYDKDPLVLDTRKFRGALSNGMLGSARELGISDNHDGIMELDQADLTPGASLAEVFRLNDHIIDIENKMFTHRPDCFGLLGVAREISGIFGHSFHSPDIYKNHELPKNNSISGLIEVRNELPREVPRFIAAVFKDVSVEASPLSRQSFLSRVGIRPINTIVDLTNYFMVLTGQPLHAYDYDKVKSLDSGGERAILVIRHPHPGEKLTLLNGKEIEPRSESIVIASEHAPVGLGGVMGGQNSEVDNNTKNIILECGTFDMYSIRRTAMAHGLFSDAVTRFNKGQSPLQNDRIVAWASESLPRAADQVDVIKLPEGTIERDSLFPPIGVTAEFINQRLGLKLNVDQIVKSLEDVEFRVEVKEEALMITAPFWRTDIEQPEDITEEVGRLTGYDQIPLELPKRLINPAVKNPLLELKSRLRRSLVRGGANEVLTYSFVDGKLLDSVTQKRDQAFILSNALSPDLQYYRLHALPSLLEKVHPNIKAGYDPFALFELNKGHNLLHADDDEDGVPTEMEFLDFVYASARGEAGSAFYMARRYLDHLAREFGLEFHYAPVLDNPDVPVAAAYELSRSAYVSTAGGMFLGMVGELKPLVRFKLKLPIACAAFTIGPSQLLGVLQKASPHYRELPKFPKIEQDICLMVSADMAYQKLYDFVSETVSGIVPAKSVHELTLIDIFKRPGDELHKQITFRLSIANFEKTMTDSEVSRLLDSIAAAAQATLSASRI